VSLYDVTPSRNHSTRCVGERSFVPPRAETQEHLSTLRPTLLGMFLQAEHHDKTRIASIELAVEESESRIEFRTPRKPHGYCPPMVKRLKYPTGPPVEFPGSRPELARCLTQHHDALKRVGSEVHGVAIKR
jgi:hypothetical protein